MTAREMFEGVLTETGKTKSPSLLLHEFNYYINKAIRLYSNKQYNIYDLNQQTTDSLRVLKTSAVLRPTPVYNGTLEKYPVGKNTTLFAGTYEVLLPMDYWHMLNCICIFRLNESHRCYNAGDYVEFPATRLTADTWSEIINNFYLKPSPERPYYYLHNVNNSVTEPTNEVGDRLGSTDLVLGGKELIIDNIRFKVTKIINSEYLLQIVDEEAARDLITAIKYFCRENEQLITDTIYYNPSISTSGNTEALKGLLYIKALDSNFYIWRYCFGEKLTDSTYYVSASTPKSKYVPVCCLEVPDIVSSSEFPRTFSLKNITTSLVDKPAYVRHSNPSTVRCEIRYGNDNSIYVLDSVIIDYIKSPQRIRLTKEQIDLTKDTSQIVEFPDSVCQEIINELVILIMNRDSDQRLLSLALVSQSIAPPNLQLTSKTQL